MTPMPREARESLDPSVVAARRRPYCARTGVCLGIASRARWEAFRCAPECAAYERITPEQAAHDLGPLLALRLWATGERSEPCP